MRLALDRLPDTQPTLDGDATAAVLVPVIQRTDGSYLLYTERAAHLSSHAGEMSFPGGRREPEDDGPLDTALREAKEEVGLDPGDAAPVGRLPDIGAPTGDAVTPYVARIPDQEYQPDPAEVTDVLKLPAAGLSNPDNYAAEPHPGMDGPAETLPYFRVDGVVVWGLTGYLTGTLLRHTVDWEPPADQPLEHPGAIT